MERKVMCQQLQWEEERAMQPRIWKHYLCVVVEEAQSSKLVDCQVNTINFQQGRLQPPLRKKNCNWIYKASMGNGYCTNND